MEIILRQYVEHLGERGDIVDIAPGYARNYLLPRKLALPATVGNKKHVERERRLVEAREADAKAHAGALAVRMAEVDLTIARRVGDTDQLYGSVTSTDIVELLTEKGFDVDRRKLILPEPIKAIGDHEVPLRLHRAVTVSLVVHVVREGGSRLEAPPAAETPTPSADESSPAADAASE